VARVKAHFPTAQRRFEVKVGDREGVWGRPSQEGAGGSKKKCGGVPKMRLRTSCF